MNGRERAVAGVVNDLGDQVLAGAALAGQQHGGGRADGHARDQVPQRRDRRRRADDAAAGCTGVAAFAAELPHFTPEPRRLERALDRRRDLVQIEGLVREVIGAELHRLDGGLDAGVRGQQDDQDVLVELLDLAQDR